MCASELEEVLEAPLPIEIPSLHQEEDRGEGGKLHIFISNNDVIL